MKLFVINENFSKLFCRLFLGIDYDFSSISRGDITNKVKRLYIF